MRLYRARIREITSMMLDSQGGVFPCHKTVDYDKEEEEEHAPELRIAKEHEAHCAGALIFAEKHGTATQIMRIAERLGLYDARKVMQHADLVFDSVEEMKKAISL